MTFVYGVVLRVKNFLEITTSEFSASMRKSARIRARYVELEYLFHISGIAT